MFISVHTKQNHKFCPPPVKLRSAYTFHFKCRVSRILLFCMKFECNESYRSRPQSKRSIGFKDQIGTVYFRSTLYPSMYQHSDDIVSVLQDRAFLFSGPFTVPPFFNREAHMIHLRSEYKFHFKGRVFLICMKFEFNYVGMVFDRKFWISRNHSSRLCSTLRNTQNLITCFITRKLKIWRSV